MIRIAGLIFLGCAGAIAASRVAAADAATSDSKDSKDPTVSRDSGDWGWTAVEAGEVKQGLQVTGRVVPEDGALHIESARVGGRVTAILKREGETVRAGDALYAVNSPDCISLATEKQLAARRGLADLLAAAKRRETQLGVGFRGRDCVVLSDHGGVLTKRGLESGGAFNPGDALATVVDTTRLMVELDVPERSVPSVRAGQRVKFQLATSPKAESATTVQYVVPAIDPATRTGKARLTPSSLPSGTTIEALVFAEIATGEDEVLLKVPSAALVFSHGKRHVIKRGAGGAEPVDVHVVNETERFSLVQPADGTALKAGDEVAGKDAIFLYRTLGSDD